MKYLILALLVSGCANKLPSTACQIPEEDKGVVIGGSISEGQPSLFGIHHGQCINKPGQISYWLQAYTGLLTVNQGIGGQTCTQVMARWTQDVFKLTPKFVWLQCGQNDFIYYSNPESTIETAYAKAIASAAEHGFKLYLVTLGHNSSNPNINSKIDSINTWIRAQASINIQIVEYGEWANQNVSVPGMFVNSIHPSKAGYNAFMGWLLDQGILK